MISHSEKLDILLDKIGVLVERLAPAVEPPVDLNVNLAFRWERRGAVVPHGSLSLILKDDCSWSETR